MVSNIMVLSNMAFTDSGVDGALEGHLYDHFPGVFSEALDLTGQECDGQCPSLSDLTQQTQPRQQLLPVQQLLCRYGRHGKDDSSCPLTAKEDDSRSESPVNVRVT